ncbi:YkgJ family cysteine cluster protein [Natrinema longum]|uniref:YkgJ family cysteine cluster protein n=1 Tax=Natrinema longum TaxID=370324 RepID=A0A8A2UDU6_9EURY|nr:YkgJ family cysteine cluster protein [Natrinema longum]MBZ6495151.1 YkgJ family cysteine cluster protein [Natrinema longum]QSW86866.1 YkgJ family cysteine cluster protein [Natrinema longum]
MKVHCEGCAGCCMDWQSLIADDAASIATRDADGGDGHETDRRRSHDPFVRREGGQGASRKPLDDDRTFVPLTREEVRAFLEAGLADALTPRFWHARDTSEGVEIDGYTVAAIADRPAFFVGLRKPPKPIAPFGREEPTWLPTCVFLDPTTLQCRIHEGDLYPDECRAYPEHNLALEQETECERVESAFGGDRLLEAGHDDPDGLLLGSQAIGAKLFCHPRPGDLDGIVDRAATGTLTRRDRAETIAIAVASSPGTLAISDHHYEWGRERALEGADDVTTERESWVGPAIREWYRRHREADGAVPSPTVADAVETDRGAPETPGWDALE